MGLDVPDLDDRDYADFLEDAMKRIPVHAEEWTDHNVHDPGVTLLELFAWVAESYTYQLDRITDEHRRKYVELAGFEPRPPLPAEANVALSVTATLDGREISTGERLAAETPSGNTEWFQSDEEITLTSASVAAVVSDIEGGLREHGTANDRGGMHYHAFGPDPRVGDALYVGFDADPFSATDRVDLWIDFHEDGLPAPATHGDESIDFEPSQRLVWEHCTDPDRWRLDTSWQPASIVDDETFAFYVGGRVRIAEPDDWDGEPIEVVDHDRALHWLRCRLTTHEPPDVERICNPQVGPPPDPHYEVPPQFDTIATNVLRVTHRQTVVDERLTTEDGSAKTTAQPNQQFSVDSAPVLEATVSVGGEQWTERPDFAASGPDDRDYVLDAGTGTITFGDGRHGMIPTPDQRVTASYDRGGGTTGDVSRESEWQFEDTTLEGVKIEPLRPPSGGRDSESIEDALARAHTERRVPHRAVTDADHRYLATHTPGLRFGRAAVAADATSDVVRVVVVPYSPPPRRAVPSEGFRQAVERHVRRHSLLTNRVEVVGPTYVGVDVAAEVKTVEGVESSDARDRAIESLETFLAPLSGFDGGGWPFGRPVHRSELYAVLEGVDAIDDVVDLAFGTRGESRLAGDGTALPYPAAIDVRVRERDETCGRGF